MEPFSTGSPRCREQGLLKALDIVNISKQARGCSVKACDLLVLSFLEEHGRVLKAPLKEHVPWGRVGGAARLASRARWPPRPR